MISKNKGTFFLYCLKWVQIIGNSFLLQGYNMINSIDDVLTEHTPLSCWNQVLDFVFPGLKILILYFFMDVASSSHHLY